MKLCGGVSWLREGVEEEEEEEEEEEGLLWFRCPRRGRGVWLIRRLLKNTNNPCHDEENRPQAASCSRSGCAELYIRVVKVGSDTRTETDTVPQN